MKLRFNAIQLAACCLFASCSVAKTGGTYRPMAQSSDDSVQNGGYGALLSAIQLSDDPALPSNFIEDDAMRERLKSDFVAEATNDACTALSVENSYVDTDAIEHILLRASAANGRSSYLLISVNEKNGGSLKVPLLLYINNGTEVPYQGIERKFLFNNNDFVIAEPILSHQSFDFRGRHYQDENKNDPFRADANAIYTMTHCLQLNSEYVPLANGKFLSEILLDSDPSFGGYQSFIAGAGTGALLAHLAVARSGAMLYASNTGSDVFAHFDGLIEVNPFYSIYAAEDRLLLRDLVEGVTEETQFTSISGIADMRYLFFRAYRNNEISADDLSYEIVKRDAYVTAPFVHMALKNYSLPSASNGPQTGALLIVHDINQTAFPVNSSRIFANVISSISFKLENVLSGIHFLYREYKDGAEPPAFGQPVTKNEFVGAGREISDAFIRPPDFLAGREKEYRWVMRGRAVAQSTGLNFQDTLRKFIDQRRKPPPTR